MMAQVIIPEVHTFGHIAARAKRVTAGNRIKAALVGESSRDSLEAFFLAAGEGLITPTLIGEETAFREAAGEDRISLENLAFIDDPEPESSVRTAVSMARDGQIDLIVADELSTRLMVEMLADQQLDLAVKGRTASHVAVLQPATYAKLLLLSDSLINPQPDLKSKLALIDNLARVSDSIGIGKPRVALLAAVEVIYPQMPVTTEAAVISKMADRRQIKAAYVDGPLSFDVAIDMPAAVSKGITSSEVAGQADAFLAPNTEVAHGVYCAMSLYCDCPAGGVIVGTRVPVATALRSDTVESRYNSILLGILSR